MKRKEKKVVDEEEVEEKDEANLRKNEKERDRRR